VLGLIKSYQRGKNDMNSNEILQILANSNDGVFAVGADNKIVFWNKSAQNILGYKAKEVLGKSYKEVIPAKDINGNPVCLRNYNPKKANNCDKGVEYYEILTNSNKANKICLSISVFYIPRSLDEYGMTVFIFRDITRQKIYEKIIQEVISKTEIADKLQITIPSIKKDDNKIRPPCRLTSREREVLILLADGHTTKFISSKLYIALSTLRKHIRNIYSKLQAHCMVEALAIARKTNLI
jgi:PAS domain S-box-containing protein